MGPHTALTAIGNVTERTTKHTEFSCKTWTTEISDFLGANNSENGRKSHLIAEIDMDHVPFDESKFLSTWISEVTNRLPGGRDRMNFLIRAIKMKTTTSVISVINTLRLELLFLLWLYFAIITNHHFLISWLLCFQHYHFNHFDKTGQPPWTQQKGQGGRPLLAFMQRYIFSFSGVEVCDT